MQSDSTTHGLDELELPQVCVRDVVQSTLVRIKLNKDHTSMFLSL